MTGITKIDLPDGFAAMSLTLRIKPVPEDLGTISAAKIWFTLRDTSDNVKLLKRNDIAGGGAAQVNIIDATPPDAYFDVIVAKGDTAGMIGKFRYDVVMEGTDAGGQAYRQVVAWGDWVLKQPETRAYT